MIPLSILDLGPVCEGSDTTAAFANMLELAQHAAALGYRRYWLAEHHNMPGIASAATPPSAVAMACAFVAAVSGAMNANDEPR